jgi:hypothetical protein
MDYNDYDDFVLGHAGGGGKQKMKTTRRPKKSQERNEIYSQKHVRTKTIIQDNAKLKRKSIQDITKLKGTINIDPNNHYNPYY